MKTVNLIGLVSLLVIALFLVSLTTVFAAIPSGATTTDLRNETAPDDTAGQHTAFAGNVTELDLYGVSTTQSWQGYFGNVTGVVQLANAADEVMYNWTLANPEGEVYASINGSLHWAYIMCFNFTATGAYGDDSSNAGDTSLVGMNLTQVEAAYNLTWDDVDGVNETFSIQDHNEFYTNNLNFSADECQSTRIYNASGAGADQAFEEVLLYESQGQAVVFASILEETEVLGFDQDYHDFEMLVLEDGHSIDQAITTYYFYVELE